MAIVTQTSSSSTGVNRIIFVSRASTTANAAVNASDAVAKLAIMVALLNTATAAIASSGILNAVNLAIAYYRLTLPTLK